MSHAKLRLVASSTEFQMATGGDGSAHDESRLFWMMSGEEIIGGDRMSYMMI